MKKNTYKIPFQSELGQRVGDYLDRCAEAEKAARDFVLSAGSRGLLPTDDSTEYVSPDDSDAGGVLAICFPSEYAHGHWDDIDHVAWDHVEKEEEGSRVLYFFPRVSIEMHYMRYDKAVRLAQRMSTEWDFVMDRERPDQIREYRFDDIRRQCPTQDVREMTPKSRVAPAPYMKVALGTRYVFDSKPDDALRAPLPNSKPFADAVALCKAVKALPTVPANSLALILGLRPQTDSLSKADVFCEYRTDQKHQCYLVHTGLVSDHPDFHPTSIQW